MTVTKRVAGIRVWGLGMLLGIAGVFPGSALAITDEIWIPYLRAHDWGIVAPYGGTTAPSLYQLPALTTPNFIWNPTQVTMVGSGNSHRSYFDQTHSQQRWRLIIHNKATAARTVTLQFYRAGSGAAITASTKWLNNLGVDTSHPLLLGSLSPPVAYPSGITWDGAKFNVSVAAEGTRVIEMGQLFNDRYWPDNYLNTSASNTHYPATLKAIVTNASYEGEVEISVDGAGIFRPRTLQASEPLGILDPVHVAQWGYQGIRRNAPSGSNVTRITFPYFKQKYLQNSIASGSPAISTYQQQSESFHGYIVNAHTATDTLLIKAWSTNGYTLYGEHYVTLQSGQEFSLMASQLLWGSGYEDGYLEVYGKSPVAVGFQVKYGRTGGYTGWAGTRRDMQAPNFLAVLPLVDEVGCCTNPCNLAYCFGGLN